MEVMGFVFQGLTLLMLILSRDQPDPEDSEGDDSLCFLEALKELSEQRKENLLVEKNLPQEENLLVEKNLPQEENLLVEENLPQKENLLVVTNFLQENNLLLGNYLLPEENNLLVVNNFLQENNLLVPPEVLPPEVLPPVVLPPVVLPPEVLTFLERLDGAFSRIAEINHRIITTPNLSPIEISQMRDILNIEIAIVRAIEAQINSL